MHFSLLNSNIFLMGQVGV